jgi:hypothetical protein
MKTVLAALIWGLVNATMVCKTSRSISSIAVVIVAGLTLASCASTAPRSVMGGECKVFKDPGFAVRGKRLKDSQWIGRTQENGITVCGWKRPTGI